MTKKILSLLVYLSLLFVGLYFLWAPVQAQALLPPGQVPSGPTNTFTPAPGTANPSQAALTASLLAGTLTVSGTPGTGTPGTGTPGTGTPGTGTPGTGTPLAQTGTALAATEEAATQATAQETPTPAAPTFTPTPTGPTRTPLPPIIRVQPRDIAGKFISAILIAVGGIGLAILGQKLVYNLLAHVHPVIQIFAARFTFIAILFSAILWILGVFNVNAATLATVLGSFGLALSLSAQDLFKNLVAGVYLLLERPFVVGDTITIGAYTGQVEVVDMRTITLRTTDGQLVIVPNTLVMSQIVVRKQNGIPPQEPPPAVTPAKEPPPK